MGIGSFWLFKELHEPFFLSLFRGEPPLPALLVRRRCPSVQRGRVSSLTTPSSPLPPHHPAGVCLSVQRGWSPPPATPFPVEKGPICATWTGRSSLLPPPPVTWVCPSVQRGPAPHHVVFTLLSLQRERAHMYNVDGHLLPQYPFSCRERARLCNMDRHLLTSFSPHLLLLLPDTPGGRPIRRGIDSPSWTAPRRTPVPRAQPPTPLLTSRDLHRVLRPATCAVSYVPRLAPHLASRAPRLCRALQPILCPRPAADARPTSRTVPPVYPLFPTIHCLTFPCDPLPHFPTIHWPSSPTTPNIIARNKAASFKH
jgi:hypothetical protein